MKENLQIVLTVLSVIVSILVIGGILIVVVGGLSLGFQAIWGLIPFGISGFILGLVIIAGTFFASKRFFPEREISMSWKLINQLEFLEIIGYLYGICSIIAALVWFVLPTPVIRSFPPLKEYLGLYIAAPLLIYGIGICFQNSIKSWRFYKTGGIFFGLCAVFGLCLVNYQIWQITEKIPGDFYLLGKAFFAFILFLQLLYIIFFHIIPSIKEFHQQVIADEKSILEDKDRSES